MVGDQSLQDSIDYVRGVPNKPKYVDSCCFIELAQVIGKNEIGRENDVWLVKQLLDAAHDAKGGLDALDSRVSTRQRDIATK